MTSIQRSILIPDGPLIEVAIGPPMPASQTPIPATPQILDEIGLVDTGTEITAVSPSVIQRLQIPSLRTAQGDAVGGVAAITLYVVSIRLPNLFIPALVVSVPQTDFPYFDCLIGRDILNRGILIYDGQNKAFTLDFP
ncbi:MAG TPA: retroviral-like aspartic protease family protein [Chthonomonadaceae bacterium]|nr:retroviral-like aspartic protease family protein [Chthonomonadaceae bacterium]